MKNYGTYEAVSKTEVNCEARGFGCEFCLFNAFFLFSCAFARWGVYCLEEVLIALLVDVVLFGCDAVGLLALLIKRL